MGKGYVFERKNKTNLTKLCYGFMHEVHRATGRNCRTLGIYETMDGTFKQSVDVCGSPVSSIDAIYQRLK